MAQSRTFKAMMLGSSKFFMILTQIVCFAILSRVLTKTSYAAYRQTLLVYAFIAPILTLGLPQALYYFLPREKEHGRNILTGNLLLLFLMGSLFVGFIWFGGGKFLARHFSNPTLSRLLFIYSPYAILVVPAGVISACLVSCDKVKILTIYNLASKIVVFVCVIGLVLIWRTSDAAIFGTVIAGFIVFFPAMFLMYRAIAGKNWQPTIMNMRTQLKYSIPLGMAVIVGTMHLNLDKIVVSYMCNPENFAIYVNGAIEIPLIGIITYSAGSIILPDLVNFYKSKDYMQVIELWKRTISKCGIILIPTMIFLFFMAPKIIRILFSPRYEASTLPFRVLLLLFIMRSMNTDAIFISSGNNKLIFIRSSISLCLNLCLSILFVHMFGYIGAAISTVFVAYFWAMPFTLFFNKRILNIEWRESYPFVNIAKIIAASFLGAIVFIGSLFVQMTDSISVITYGIIYSGFTIFFLNWFKMIDVRSLVFIARSKYNKFASH